MDKEFCMGSIMYLVENFSKLWNFGVELKSRGLLEKLAIFSGNYGFLKFPRNWKKWGSISSLAENRSPL